MATYNNTTTADEQRDGDKTPVLRERQIGILQPELGTPASQEEEAEIEEAEENKGDQLNDQSSLQDLCNRHFHEM